MPIDSQDIITEQITHDIIDENITHSLSEEVISHIIDPEQWPPWPAWADWQANPWDFAYPHNQAVANAEWDIMHNLGFYPNVQIMDSAWDLVTPMKIIHDSVNRTRIQFLWSMSGQAYLS